jgi:Zn-dependent M28 family amino/carboxypeptidase
MTEWIGETFTSDVGWEHLETLVDLETRMAGSDGERRAAEATRDALEAVGARDVRLEPFEIRGWTRGSSEITARETTQDCIALPRSPGEEASGELVDLGYGLPSDFDRDLDGAVVLVASDVPGWYDRYVHRREKFYRAVEAGAAAFVYANHVEGCLPPTGSVGTAADPIGDIPAVGVSKEVGARLGRRFAGEAVTVTVDAEAHEAISRNVHADLGPETDEAVLLTSHVDAHDIAEGAADNGAGTAMVLEVARALASREADLDTRVHCLVFGAEEVGLVGSHHDADRRDLSAVSAVVNNDGVVRDRTLQCWSHGFEDLATVAERVGDRLGHPIEVSPSLNPPSDHWPYVARGVPGCHVRSDTGDRGRGWGHTHADTLDKLSVRNLREQAIVLTELVVELAGDGTTVSRRAPSAIAEQLEAENRAEGVRIVGDWPYDDV